MQKWRHHTCRICERQECRNTGKCIDCRKPSITYCCDGCAKKRKEYQRKQRNTSNGVLRRLIRQAKASIGRRKKLFCDIEKEDLDQLLKKQNHKCAVTNTIMIFESGHPLCVSLDRIDSDCGYIKQNVHLVCRWVNLGRNTFPLDEFKQILSDYKTS